MTSKNLIRGKWYILSDRWFLKFDRLEGDICWGSEVIKDGKITTSDWYYLDQVLSEATKEELRKFLPANHPDLNNYYKIY